MLSSAFMLFLDHWPMQFFRSCEKWNDAAAEKSDVCYEEDSSQMTRSETRASPTSHSLPRSLYRSFIHSRVAIWMSVFFRLEGWEIDDAVLCGAVLLGGGRAGWHTRWCVYGGFSYKCIVFSAILTTPKASHLFVVSSIRFHATACAPHII